MAIQLRQQMNLRLEQKLRLTPQMIQSIEILLLPQMALAERIMTELEANPLLEIVDDGAASTETAGERPAGATATTAVAPVDAEVVERFGDLEHEHFSEWLKIRRQAANLDEDAPDRMAAIDATAGPPPALADHLLEQLRFLDLGPEDLDRARVICWQLDRRGWLPEPLELLFDQDELAAAQRVWELVRRCDPPGVGARDLRDCLLLQLAREPGDNSFEVAVVQNHLEDLLHNRLPAVAAACGVEIARVEEALQVIARLNPAPGAAFVRGDNQIIIPDVVVERDEHDEWVVSVPDSHLPKIEINQSNYQLLDRRDAPLADRQFFREKMSSARSIIEAVNQRKRTLLRITTEIVKHQQDFLEFGPGHLRPLMRQDIADRIGMHVATVSRAVKDKWIQTPSGAIPLAQFFSGGISTMSGGEAESSRSVKLRIKALIESEDPRRPLSDQAIADRLTREGLDISRRTVTKYRIAENLPSTRQRRSFAGR